MEAWYHKEAAQAVEQLNSNLAGLTTEEAKRRLEADGYNQLAEGKRKGVIQVFLEQFKDLLVIILIIAAAISLLTHSAESTIVIISVLILNAILGTVQHFKAEKSLNSLKALSAPTSKVLRDGVKIEIPSKELVVGDILLLEAGDLVAADGRIIENFSLQVNESSLTGESESVNKNTDTLDSDNVALGDQLNMVFSSSLVTYGRATVVVTATGMHTEIGKIAQLMNQTQEKKTPLQVSLDDFSKKLSIVIMIISAILFGLSLLRGTPVIDSLMFAVALAVAAIPEALSSIVTIALAIGTQKMAKENAIIKNLRAVEGLGCVSIICSDKTGTLTQNKMTVQKVFADGRSFLPEETDVSNPVQKALLHGCLLCNDSVVTKAGEVGDPTEVALVNYYNRILPVSEQQRSYHTRLQEIPFDSDRKLMSTLHVISGRNIMLTKGALDVLLPRIERILTAEGERPVTEEDKKTIQEANLECSKQGLRVLAFAQKQLETQRELTTEDENGFTFIGMVAMMDPPREESAQAVADCRRAGIKPIMITGDHKITATSIAKQIGIFEDGDLCLDGPELATISDEELAEKLPHISVYARVSPEHKIRIVTMWQQKGHIVAMTGDGVNDAPALKKADVGIAMGITGTAVSKDAASMILTDDNFATIVKSVGNGRTIYNNIKNSIKFLISGNTSGILAVLYTVLFALPMPFTAVHLLFINLLTDSLPALAISMEPSDRDLLNEKPRSAKESILTRGFLKDVALQGLLIAAFTLAAFHLGLITDAGTASTMAFSTLCLARLFHGFNCRGKKSLSKLGLLTNKYSLGAFGVGLVFLLCALLIPPLQSLFDVTPLSWINLLSVLVLAAMPTICIQVTRMIRQAVKAHKEKKA